MLYQPKVHQVHGGSRSCLLDPHQILHSPPKIAIKIKIKIATYTSKSIISENTIWENISGVICQAKATSRHKLVIYKNLPICVPKEQLSERKELPRHQMTSYESKHSASKRHAPRIIHRRTESRSASLCSAITFEDIPCDRWALKILESDIRLNIL